MTDFERNDGRHDAGGDHLSGFERTDIAGVPGAHSEALQTQEVLDREIQAVLDQLDGLDLDIAGGEDCMGGINQAATYRFGSSGDSLNASL